MKSIWASTLFILFALLSANGAEAVATNGFLLIEIGRLDYNQHTGATVSNITQRFKVPLTAEFMSNFRGTPGQDSEGTGFLCAGGALKSSPGSGFAWWIHRTADNRWRINMWGYGSETIEGVKMNSPRPAVSQNLTIKRWEDLDMSYMLSYPGLNVVFAAKYVTAEDMKTMGSVVAAPVKTADGPMLFKGDDMSGLPLEIDCLFQEG